MCKQKVDTVKDVVKCPNMCLDGKVKYNPNPDRALFDLKDCPYCEGKGEVSKQEAEEIEKQI